MSQVLNRPLTYKISGGGSITLALPKGGKAKAAFEAGRPAPPPKPKGGGKKKPSPPPKPPMLFQPTIEIVEPQPPKTRRATSAPSRGKIVSESRLLYTVNQKSLRPKVPIKTLWEEAIREFPGKGKGFRVTPPSKKELVELDRKLRQSPSGTTSMGSKLRLKGPGPRPKAKPKASAKKALLTAARGSQRTPAQTRAIRLFRERSQFVAGLKEANPGMSQEEAWKIATEEVQ